MDIGRNFLNAVSALKSGSEEILELFGEFGLVLANRRSNNGILFRALTDADPIHYQAGWTQDGWRQSFGVYEGANKVRKKHQIGEITLAVDLGRSHWLAERLGYACLYVFWAGPDDAWGESLDTPGEFVVSEENYTLIDDQIFVWRSSEDDDKLLRAEFKDGPRDFAWFFVVPLTAVDSRKQVHEVLAKPIFDMLNGQPPQLPMGHPALRFGWIDGLPKMKESY